MPERSHTDDVRSAAVLDGAVFVCAVLAAVVLACAGGDVPPVVERADSAGIEVVVSGPDDRPLAWSFTERFALGGEEESPESFYRLVPARWAPTTPAGSTSWTR